ncbi:uncharacterized protein LOC129592255 [Paramacrobiotus metropolitanus]|uniref:uncharacterized protein LOC129592255 n=1 Tax=Paramacrobiotus metropolitanus TaxID=2943436 RepID=UPI002445FBAC|nr:uncharacterized protein LOC129592255 [Paramacrobiotus metropolitanus]
MWEIRFVNEVHHDKPQVQQVPQLKAILRRCPKSWHGCAVNSGSGHSPLEFQGGNQTDGPSMPNENEEAATPEAQVVEDIDFTEIEALAFGELETKNGQPLESTQIDTNSSNNKEMEEEKSRSICELRKAGSTNLQIAERLGISFHTVNYTVRKNEVFFRPQLTEEKNEEIIKRAQDGKCSEAQTARQFKVAAAEWEKVKGPP